MEFHKSVLNTSDTQSNFSSEAADDMSPGVQVTVIFFRGRGKNMKIDMYFVT